MTPSRRQSCLALLSAGCVAVRYVLQTWCCWYCVQALAAAREEEFERWKGHLEELEVALQAAQQESLTYR